MDAVSFFKMDIFFIVTTFVVLLIGLFLSVLLYYAVRILRSIEKVVSSVKTEAEEVVKDFREVRKDIKAGVREVREGITTAKGYTKTIAGAGVAKIISNAFESFIAQKTADTKPRKKSTKRKKDGAE